MKEIKKINYTYNINEINIFPNNLDSWKDKIWFKNLIDSLFEEKDIILFKCIRENDFYIEKKIIAKLRTSVPEYFNKWGEYFLFNEGMTTLSAYGALEYSANHVDFILDVWNYFENIIIFPIKIDMINLFVENHDFQRPATEMEKLFQILHPMF